MLLIRFSSLGHFIVKASRRCMLNVKLCVWFFYWLPIDQWNVYYVSTFAAQTFILIDLANYFFRLFRQFDMIDAVIFKKPSYKFILLICENLKSVYHNVYSNLWYAFIYIYDLPLWLYDLHFWKYKKCGNLKINSLIKKRRKKLKRKSFLYLS